MKKLLIFLISIALSSCATNPELDNSDEGVSNQKIEHLKSNQIDSLNAQNVPDIDRTDPSD